MGEVVEISIVAKKLNVYEQILCFFTSYIGEKYDIQSITAMDNWRYENLIKLNSVSDANRLVQDKIICIELKTNNRYLGVGVFVEKKKDLFYIDGWINPKEDILGQEYDRLLNLFVETFKSNSSVKASGIGKEIFVDYNSGIPQAIENAHNIDLWMIFGSEYINYNTKSKIICIQ